MVEKGRKMRKYIDIINETNKIAHRQEWVKFFMARRADGAEPSPPQKRMKSGTLVTMTNGQKWFHAYDGSQPIIITDDNENLLSFEN